HAENELETASVLEIVSFILELGVGFTFVARQKRIVIDGEDYHLDLLFFHRNLQRLNCPSIRSCAEVQRLGVRVKRTFVFSFLRVRTHDRLRFSFLASSASRIVPSKASSSRVQGRACSQH